ncbi:Helix-turn-helix domain protein [Actinoalloteichus hoggarensis]|uniref:Helix-turn-helix domain protein n=2 Tax=Actinoalloteichus hoggarensis TaxID=1470176 RepID=A0A221W5W6_9PSEU|nr:Helix-turn-helix domain protein [Actinoalloteichus hoggarensis]
MPRPRADETAPAAEGRRETPPLHSALHPWVESVSLDDVGGPTGPRRRRTQPPDPATALVWRTTAEGRSDLLVLGPRTRAAYRAGKELPLCVRLRLRPGHAESLLDVPVDEIADRTVPLRDLWGRQAALLAEELADLGADPPGVLRRLETTLLGRVTDRTGPALDRVRLLRAATARLAGGLRRTPERLGDVARDAGLSERRLRTVFTSAVGLSPRRFARVTRVRTVLAATSAGVDSWSRLAVDAGYYDQSHLTAEFREVMQVTPGRFAAGRLPEAAPCRS